MTDIPSYFDGQKTAEVKQYATNFGDYIPAGGSVASASAAYAQTFGGAASGSCAVGVSGGSVVYHTSPGLSLPGSYTFTVSASLSDGQLRKALWFVKVDA